MATEKECPYYDTCGFVKWRSELGSFFGAELPENGDCGIPVDPTFCLRQNPMATSVQVEFFGPATTREFKVGGMVKEKDTR